MLLPADQRRQLGAFLRAKREALSPPAAGGPSGGRRRTPGLRREEVAIRSGLSTTWVSWVEQGRDIGLSEAALARLAAALLLSPAERAYLFNLARRRDPAGDDHGQDGAAALAAAVGSIAAPAYVLDPSWTVVHWNAAAAHLFAPWFETGESNLLRFVFLQPAARSFIADWTDRARRVIAEFRADTASGEAAATGALLADMLASSADFAALWSEQSVLSREGGVRRFSHPLDGPVVLRQMTLVPATHPAHKLVMLVPLNEIPSTAAVPDPSA